MLYMQSRLVRIAIVLGVILAVLLVGKFGYSAVQQARLRHTSDLFIGRILANDASDSYKMFTKGAQSNESASYWQGQVAKFSTFFAGQKPQLAGSNTETPHKTFDYSIKGLSGSYRLTVTVVKQGLGWGIYALDAAPETP